MLNPSGVSVAFDTDSGADGKNAALPSFTATTAGVYKVIVVGEDDGGGEYVLAVNWSPVLDNLHLSSDMIFENESVSLTGTYSDQNLDDSHTVEVDWGDPSASANSTFDVPAINTLAVADTFASTTDGAVLEITSLDLLRGEVGFEVTDHQYLDDGPAPGNGTAQDESTIAITVTDDRGLSETSSSGGGSGEILLIEDQGGFGAAASVLTGAGFSATVVNNEFSNGYANLLDSSFMAGFDFVVYGERGTGSGNQMPTTVMNSLENYLQGGGDLLVTRYDTLGSPTDTNLATLIRAVSPNDQVSTDPNWQTANINNFILNGPFGCPTARR